MPFMNRFTTPAGTFSVAPDSLTAQQGSRSINVTNFVNGGARTYTTESVSIARTAANLIGRLETLREFIKMRVYHFEIYQCI
ncbi:hypothetical protein ICU_01826 [Bacillus cereus BAG2X1-1]|nr:hypothetical protein ICU_01826 [Bacillus cereus BAG2X1-1]